jgi:FAD binding domain-containing protein/berberine-like enzyme
MSQATRTETATTVFSADTDRLRSAIAGRVVVPGEPEYEAARIVFRGEVDKHPAVIARVANAADVAQVIAFARETGLELAVRCGGHSGAGHSTTNGGIVLDVREMKSLDIDRENRTAWAESGLTAVELTSAAWAEGMQIGFGDTGSVGIAGITLGGGIGYLVRKHGLTIDNLLAAELVTADGTLLNVDADSHPDLFWAIRGGGGNFGVATRFKYRLHEASGFVGGMLILPATAETITGFMTAANEAPEELSTIANVMNCPPMPFVPEEVVGQIVIFALLAYSGDVEAGERAIAPFRQLATPIADEVREMPYPEIYGPEGDGSYRPKALDHTMFLDHVDLAAAQTMLDHLNASDASLRAVQLRALGGAMARVPVDATAFAHRQRRILAVVVNFFEGEDDLPKRAAWTRDLAAAIDQGVPGAYVNFLRDESDEGSDRLHAAYPGATWDRLASIKKRYDPTNLFRLNQNIPPA